MNIRWRIYVILCVLSISLCSGCKEAETQEIPVKRQSVNYAPGELIVKFEPEAFDEEGELVSESIKALNAKYELISMEPIFRRKVSDELAYIYKLEFPEAVDIMELVHEYTEDPFVVYAEPNYIARIAK